MQAHPVPSQCLKPYWPNLKSYCPMSLFHLNATRLEDRSRVCQALSPQKASSLFIWGLEEDVMDIRSKSVRGDLLVMAHRGLAAWLVTVRGKQGFYEGRLCD